MRRRVKTHQYAQVRRDHHDLGLRRSRVVPEQVVRLGVARDLIDVPVEALTLLHRAVFREREDQFRGRTTANDAGRESIDRLHADDRGFDLDRCSQVPRSQARGLTLLWRRGALQSVGDFAVTGIDTTGAIFKLSEVRRLTARSEVESPADGVGQADGGSLHGEYLCRFEGWGRTLLQQVSKLPE